MQQNHDGSGKRKRKGGRDDAGQVDFAAESLREGVHTGNGICRESAKETDGVAIYSVAWAGGFGEWREKEQVGSRAEGRKYKGTASNQGQQRQRCNGDEAIKEYVNRPNYLWR